LKVFTTPKGEYCVVFNNKNESVLVKLVLQNDWNACGPSSYSNYFNLPYAWKYEIESIDSLGMISMLQPEHNIEKIKSSSASLRASFLAHRNKQRISSVRG